MKTHRWYMVNKIGMATLCSDKAGAEQEAADAQRFWPHMGPHRAVRLVEARFEAADMATAAADGFRAGQDACFQPADMATASADGFRDGAAHAVETIAELKGQRAVLCSLLGECLPVIDALMQIPGDDDSDAHLNGLAGRIMAAQAVIAEAQVKGGES